MRHQDPFQVFLMWLNHILMCFLMWLYQMIYIHLSLFQSTSIPPVFFSSFSPSVLISFLSSLLPYLPPLLWSNLNFFLRHSNINFIQFSTFWNPSHWWFETWFMDPRFFDHDSFQSFHVRQWLYGTTIFLNSNLV